MKKLNPKKNKEARRKRNPLVVVGVGVPGKRSMFYEVRKTCPNCMLRSMKPHDEMCSHCLKEKREERIKQLGDIDPSDMTPVNNN